MFVCFLPVFFYLCIIGVYMEFRYHHITHEENDNKNKIIYTFWILKL